MQEIEENNRMGKTRDHFKKTGEIKGTFHARMGMIMGKKSKDLTSRRDSLVAQWVKRLPTMWETWVQSLV